MASSKKEFLINLLNEIQDNQGYIPPTVRQELAKEFGLPESQVSGLVSFFKAFRNHPPGKHQICVCYGTACYARGSPLLYDHLVRELQLQESDTSPDGFATVEQVYCIGACSQAPLMVVDGQIKGKLKSYQVPLILAELRDQHESQEQ